MTTAAQTVVVLLLVLAIVTTTYAQCSTSADLGSNGCCSNDRCPSSCSNQGFSTINGRVSCTCTGCPGGGSTGSTGTGSSDSGASSTGSGAEAAPPSSLQCSNGQAPLDVSGCCADSCRCPPGSSQQGRASANGLTTCTCGSSSAADGCTSTESDDGEELTTKADDDDRYTFLAIYFGLMAAMFVAVKCLIKDSTQGKPGTEPEPAPEPEPEPEAGAKRKMIKLVFGVIDDRTGSQMGLINYFMRNHDLLKLCFDDTETVGEIRRKGSRFKTARFAFVLCFTVAVALMFQSLSIEATTQVASTRCTENEGGRSSMVQQQTITQGGDGGGMSFSDAGGWKVVGMSMIFKQAEGPIGDKTLAAFKAKKAFTEYAILRSFVHLVGFVMAIALGVVQTADGQTTQYVQRYCDAEDPGPSSEAEAGVAGIYIQAVLTTAVANWIFVDNLKFLLKYYVGAWLLAKDEGTDGVSLKAVTSAPQGREPAVETEQPQPIAMDQVSVAISASAPVNSVAAVKSARRNATQRALKIELQPLTVGELRKKASAMGVDDDVIERARDGDDPKADLSALIVAQAAQP